MQNEVVTHLVIVGKNPNDNEYSIGLAKSGEALLTIQESLPIPVDPDASVCRFAALCIDAPPDWYTIRKQTFLVDTESKNGCLHLIYVATLPINIKLKHGVKWYAMSSLASLNFANEIEKDIILEGIKL